MTVRKMPERKQPSMRRKKTCPPNLQLVSWPEQHHHISSSRTKPVSDIERIHSVSDCRERNVFPKQAPHSCQQRVSVLRIIPNALGCCLCLTFNLSTGEPVWKKEKKLMGAIQRPWLHLVYLWITACHIRKKRRRKSKQKIYIYFLFPLMGFC